MSASFFSLLLPALESEVTYIPNMEVEVTDEEQKEKVLSLIEQLEDIDDVQSVYFNMKD